MSAGTNCPVVIVSKTAMIAANLNRLTSRRDLYKPHFVPDPPQSIVS